MRTPLSAVTTAVTLALAGCSFDWIPSIDPANTADQQTAARHIEIEVADLATGLPCQVIDRTNAESRDVLWRAEFEDGFCRRKAEETRLILETKGWACRQQDADERQDLVPAAARDAAPSHLVAAWRCVEGLPPIERTNTDHPPVPSVKPDLPGQRTASWGNDALQKAVARDLAAIGQEIVDIETAVDAALGDLNDDGIDDAVAILTRDADSGAPHRMLMAYLRGEEAYNLVDVWILDAPVDQPDGKLTVAIEDGRVRLETCCGERLDPTVLILSDRKLTHAPKG